MKLRKFHNTSNNPICALSTRTTDVNSNEYIDFLSEVNALVLKYDSNCVVKAITSQEIIYNLSVYQAEYSLVKKLYLIHLYNIEKILICWGNKIYVHF